MTPNTRTPAEGGARPLTQEGVGKLKAGRSVFLHEGALWLLTHQPNAAYFGRLMPISVENVSATEKLTVLPYIGERDENGWIFAPEGGWPENPAPGMVVEVRGDDGDSEAFPSESWDWSRRNDNANIIAFRPLNRPEREGPRKSLGCINPWCGGGQVCALCEKDWAKRQPKTANPQPLGGDYEGHDLIARLREGARDLHPYSLGEIDSPSLNVALPAYLNDAADRITDLEERLSVMRGALEDEKGWLIEIPSSPRPLWFALPGHWKMDASEALRFARREDAEAFLEHEAPHESAFVSEHTWPAAQALSTTPGKSDV